MNNHHHRGDRELLIPSGSENRQTAALRPMADNPLILLIRLDHTIMQSNYSLCPRRYIIFVSDHNDGASFVVEPLERIEYLPRRA